MTYPIKTKRLQLRNWKITDLEAMTAINQSANVMRFFPNKPDLDATQAYIKRMQHQFDKSGYCYFAAERIDTQEFIGFIGLMYQDYIAPFTPCVDIGWRLKETAWGKGYATEGATACIEYAFNTLNLKEIYSVAPMINIPSIAVMEKIGMQKLYTFPHPALNDFPNLQECVLYHIKNPK